MARVTAIFALLATVALIVVFTRRVGQPISQLVERIQ
jgi:nitrogen fixation/metabolism regulation signal transduction histidine kinase